MRNVFQVTNWPFRSSYSYNNAHKSPPPPSSYLNSSTNNSSTTTSGTGHVTALSSLHHLHDAKFSSSNSIKKEKNNNNNLFNFNSNFNTLTLDSHTSSTSNSNKGQKSSSFISSSNNNNNNNNGTRDKYSQSALFLQHILYPSIASKPTTSFTSSALLSASSNPFKANLVEASDSKNNNKKHKCDGCDKVYTKSKATNIFSFVYH